MKEKLLELSSKVSKYMDENSPALLTGATVAGIFATAWMAFKAGPKAQTIIDAHREYFSDGHDDRTEKEEVREETKELVKELAPVLLPPVGMAIATSAFAISSNKISSKRLAVLSAAYTMTESALKDYQNKVEELFDEKKVNKIKESIAKDKMDKNPLTPNTDVIITNNGDVLCMDDYSGRYFRSNAQKIGNAINELTADLQSDMYVSLNEFYDKLGLQRIPMGDDFGWRTDDLNRGSLDINMTALLTEDKQPCLVITYDLYPSVYYRHLH